MGVLHLATDVSLDNLVTAAQAAASDDSAAMDAILRRFEGKALAIARSLTTNRSLQQDAAQGARLGLVQAVRSHTVGTPGFPSYAARYMKGAALRTLMAMLGDEVTIDPADYAWLEKPARDGAADTTFEVLDMLSVLTPTQQAVAKAFYVDDVSVTDIASLLSISKPAVTQRFATIHRALRPVAESAVAA